MVVHVTRLQFNTLQKTFGLQKSCKQLVTFSRQRLVCVPSFSVAVRNESMATVVGGEQTIFLSSNDIFQSPVTTSSDHSEELCAADAAPHGESIAYAVPTLFLDVQEYAATYGGTSSIVAC